MAGYQVYQFILSLIVFIILTGLFGFFIVWAIKLNIQLIKSGTHDEKITTEYKKQQAKKQSVFGKIASYVVLVLCCAVVFVSFAFSLVVSANDGKVCSGLPALNVVESDSMSYVSTDNKYSYGKGYTDQMQMFDLVLTHELPAEKDLKVGDVVVYEQGEYMIIHRIVAIEEPNANHSERHFLLQGDANKNADMFPVRYNQMKAIYKGQRIPFVGSFVKFMQSPAGWLCILLVVFAVVATPVAEKKLATAKTNRLKIIGVIADDVDEQAEPVSVGEQAEPVSMGEEVENEPEQEQNEVVATVASPFANFGKGKTFEQKIEDADDVLLHRYYQISDLLCSIQKCRVVRGKKHETYRKGNSPVAKLAIRGKTLNVYLALNPGDYTQTKYKFVDVSDSKTFANYPMRLKITSDRQVRWAKELICDMATQHGWSIVEPPVVEQETEEERHNKLFFAHLQGMRASKTFEQKLAQASDLLKDRYNKLADYLGSIKKISARQSKKALTYRRGRVPVAKLVIRGKTLNLYLALNPSDYADTKYNYQDVSNRKAYKDFAMRLKMTSDRQIKWAKELINDLVAKKGLTFVPRGDDND